MIGFRENQAMMRRVVVSLTLILSPGAVTAPAAGPAGTLSAQQLTAIWEDLGGNDHAGTAAARAGIQALIAAPESAVPFLKSKLRPISAPDARHIARCLADLDSPTFAVRERATRELEEVGPLAVPAIERKLEDKLSLEARRRLEAILERLDRHVLTADDLRALRAIEVLQGIASIDALGVLEAMAGGAEGSVLTVQARHALDHVRQQRHGR
jgi:hypothetical protein